MPYVEISTSQKSLSFDSDGFAYLTRTFKVWGVDPKTFFDKPSNIPAHGGGPAMPDYGHVMLQTAGPDGTISPGRDTKVFLYKYTLEPESHLVYVATAYYSNDNRLHPYASGVSGTTSFGFADIPYIRFIGTIDIGNSNRQQEAGVKVTPVEAIYRARLQQSRMTQRVAIPRAQWYNAQLTSAREAGTIHKIDGEYYLFEGHTVNDRGPQVVDITYTWLWESGVEDLSALEKDYDKSGTKPDVKAILKPIYPKKVSPLTNLGPDRAYVLPPFHTIELLYNFTVDTSNIVIREPYWRYRLPYEVSSNGASSLVGHADFDWGEQ